MMSSVRIGTGNCMKTGNNAVDIGRTSSKLDGCGLIRVMSLVASVSVKTAAKRANSI